MVPLTAAFLLRRCHSRLLLFPKNIRSMSLSFPVTASIEAKLSRKLNPTYLDVMNESHMHNVPANSETHFKVVVVSDEFTKLKTPLQRHRLVNSTLQEELDGPVHALGIVAKTPEQWKMMQEQGTAIPPSPNCRGGDGSLPKKNETVTGTRSG